MFSLRDRRGRDRIVVRFTTTCAISASHHYVVSWNPAHAEVYSIQHYVITFVSDFRQTGRWFSHGTPVSSTNKTDHHDLIKTLLKVALNTMTL